MRFASVLPLVTTLAFGGCVNVGDPPGPADLGTYRIGSTLQANTCGYGGLPIDGFVELSAEIGGYPGERASFEWVGRPGASIGTASVSGTYQFAGEQTTEMLPPDELLGYVGCSVRQRTEIVFTIDPTPVRPTDAGADAGDGAVSADAGTDAGSDAGPDAGAAAPSTLTGTMTIDIIPVQGTDCTPLLGLYGGPFNTLPCQSRQSLAGVRE